MTRGHEKQELLAELEQVLETYGGSMRRWPADARLRLSGFVASDETARRLVGEAKALDRLIEAASGEESARASRLADRIARLADAEDRAAEPAGAPAPGGAAPGRIIPLRPGQSKRPAYSAVQAWATAAALAGFLAIGVLAGQSGLIDPALENMAGVEERMIDLGDPLFEEDVI